MADAQDRNLPASERKLRKARAEGQVARSRDLGHFAVVAVAMATLGWTAPASSDALRQWLAKALRFDAALIADPSRMLEPLSSALLPLFWTLALCGALAWLTALAVALVGGGWNFTLKAVGFKLEKLDPLAGIARLMSLHQLGDTLKTCALALVLAVVGVMYLKRELPTFGGVMSLPLRAAGEQVAVLLQQGVLWLLLALAAFAALDVPLQRFRLGSQLKMSRTEVKEEAKEAEGSGEVKQRQRQRMREMANRRMLAAVPKADLVVMNPSHYAVALRYDDATMSAPRVVAKGSDLMAFRIRDAAKENKVPVLQAPPLARALYAHAELDREVPAALFAAVAQVLAYVYQLREAMAGRVPMPNEPTELPVPPTLDPLHGRA
jgi:flagellar biosynthesis protein FlhB